MSHREIEGRKLTIIFEDFIRGLNEFPEILDIARKNSQGKVLIIGGFVYRPIINVLYGESINQDHLDIDFLIEERPKNYGELDFMGWTPKMTRYGNLRLERGNIGLDLNYLFNFHSIQKRNITPRIKHFFPGTPLDLQSIAYDLSTERRGVIGWRGIQSIKRRIVKINDLDEAKYDAKSRGITVEDLLRQKAESVGFSFDLSSMNPTKSTTFKEVAQKLDLMSEK